jgi:hypothetical protein
MPCGSGIHYASVTSGTWRGTSGELCNDMAVNQVKPDSLEAYVRAALALQGYAFDEARIAEIILQFSRIEVIARTVIDWPLPFAAQVVPALRP